LKICQENIVYYRLEVVVAGVLGTTVQLFFKQSYGIYKWFAFKNNLNTGIHGNNGSQTKIQ